MKYIKLFQNLSKGDFYYNKEMKTLACKDFLEGKSLGNKSY